MTVVVVCKKTAYFQLSVFFWHIKDAGASCADDDLSMNSKCYRKFFRDRALTWYGASSDCLYHGGSLAVFDDIGRPSDNSQLTNWLNTSGNDKIYWIGLIQPWWKITDKGDELFLCSYNNNNKMLL